MAIHAFHHLTHFEQFYLFFTRNFFVIIAFTKCCNRGVDLIVFLLQLCQLGKRVTQCLIEIGKTLAERAKKAGVTAVVFDRNGQVLYVDGGFLASGVNQ